MNRILGSAVKAAVSISVSKQIAAAGLSKIRTTTRWSGKTAYAAWSDKDKFTATAVINYPLLSDEALLTRREADLIAAYTLHETGHVIYTQRTRLTGDLHSIWNGIEDGWMENQVIKAGQAKGARQLFTRLLNKLTHDLRPSFNPCQLSDSAFALAILCREAFGNGNAFSASLLDRIPQPKRGLYETVMQEVLASSNSYDNATLATAFYTAFQALDADKDHVQAESGQQPPPSSDDYWENDGDEETPAQDDALEDNDVIVDPPPPVQSDDKSDDPPSFGESDGESDDESDDEPDEPSASSGWEDDFDDDAFDDGSADEDDVEGSDGELDDEPGEDGEADGEPGDEPEGDEGEPEGIAAGDGEADSEADEAGDADTEPGFSDGQSNGKPVDVPEPSIDDIVNRVQKRTTEKGQLPQYVPASRSEQPKDYWNDVGQFGPTPGALKTQLSRLLLSVDRIGWDNGATSGRFDVRRTSRMMAGSERVFKKRWESEAINSRVTILVDMSTSMDWVQAGGKPIDLCSDVAYALADVCERVGCAVEVVGFKSGCGHSAHEVRDMEGISRKAGSFAYEAADLVEYKKFGQRVKDAAKGLYMMRHHANGGTPDAHALRTCVETMGITNEHRRLVLVLTDGFGSPDKVRAICDVAPKRGVTVLGIGILTDPEAMSIAYPVNACASSLQELSTVAIRSLIKQVG